MTKIDENNSMNVVGLLINIKQTCKTAYIMRYMIDTLNINSEHKSKSI